MRMIPAARPLVACLALTVANAQDHGLMFAVNVGGPAGEAIDGTAFESEAGVSGGRIRRIDRVKGSQDAFLYRTCREGDIRFSRRMADGTYDVTLYFAEPDDLRGGERVFDVILEGRPAVEAVDVMAMRDGRVRSALTVTVPRVVVADGALDAHIRATEGSALLSAIVARRPRPRTAEWHLHWQDEFDGDALDTEKWTAERWPARKVNDEDQAYTARPANLRVTDGTLVIEARKEPFAGAAYTSARVHSRGKADFLYGRFEVRALLPRGMGTWPAIWMLPSNPYRYATSCGPGDDWQGNATCDAWPNSGEIDIMEHVGYQMGHVHGTVHNEAYYWLKWEQRKGRVIVDDVERRFHVYALEWTPTRIDAYVDDTLYFTYVNEQNGWRSWPFDHPFHLVLNVAVGGMWGRAGGGIDDSVFPQQMRVDYVRVYQHIAPAGQLPAAPPAVRNAPALSAP